MWNTHTHTSARTPSSIYQYAVAAAWAIRYSVNMCCTPSSHSAKLCSGCEHFINHGDTTDQSEDVKLRGSSLAQLSGHSSLSNYNLGSISDWGGGVFKTYEKRLIWLMGWGDGRGEASVRRGRSVCTAASLVFYLKKKVAVHFHHFCPSLSQPNIFSFLFSFLFSFQTVCCLADRAM